MIGSIIARNAICHGQYPSLASYSPRTACDLALSYKIYDPKENVLLRIGMTSGY